MTYDVDLVGWIHSVEVAVEWRWPPVWIIETERVAPGLIDDLMTLNWQRRLVKEQEESGKKDPDARDDR